MKFKKSFWLAGGVLLLFMLGFQFYGMGSASMPSVPFSNTAVESLQPDSSVVALPPPLAIDTEALAASLSQTLDARLAAWDRRKQAQSEAQASQVLAKFQEWRETLDEQSLARTREVAELDRRLDGLEQGIAQLLRARELKRSTGENPGFLFRGMEIWHGQTYALLEYEGRILPVRQGESRLGWRVHFIDREHRKLHVSDGRREVVMEAQ